jgi:hypothetical protein
VSLVAAGGAIRASGVIELVFFGFFVGLLLGMGQPIFGPAVTAAALFLRDRASLRSKAS